MQFTQGPQYTPFLIRSPSSAFIPDVGRPSARGGTTHCSLSIDMSAAASSSAQRGQLSGDAEAERLFEAMEELHMDDDDNHARHALGVHGAGSLGSGSSDDDSSEDDDDDDDDDVDAHEDDDELDGSEEEASWIAWFCSLRENSFLCEVEEDYIEDDFNLTGLSSIVPYYDYALDIILDIETPNGTALRQAGDGERERLTPAL